MHPNEYAGRAPSPSPDPNTFLSDTSAAELLNLSRSYLRKLRLVGGGPRFSRLGERAIRYRRADLLAWAASKSVGSTSELEAA